MAERDRPRAQRGTRHGARHGTRHGLLHGLRREPRRGASVRLKPSRRLSVTIHDGPRHARAEITSTGLDMARCIYQIIKQRSWIFFGLFGLFPSGLGRAWMVPPSGAKVPSQLEAEYICVHVNRVPSCNCLKPPTGHPYPRLSVTFLYTGPRPTEHLTASQDHTASSRHTTSRVSQQCPLSRPPRSALLSRATRLTTTPAGPPRGHSLLRRCRHRDQRLDHLTIPAHTSRSSSDACTTRTPVRNENED